MKRLTLAALAASALAAFPASAAKPQALNLASAPSQGFHSAWIEQQDDWPKPELFIRNPYPDCHWAANDWRRWTTVGVLEPGESASTQECVVSDFSPVHATRYGTTAWWSMAAYGFFSSTVSEGLTATVCYEPQGRCFNGTSFCGRASYGPDDPALVEIPGSRGGRGVVTTITLTVTNPTSRRIRNALVEWSLSSDLSACNPDHSEYPFTWAE